MCWYRYIGVRVVVQEINLYNRFVDYLLICLYIRNYFRVFGFRSTVKVNLVGTCVDVNILLKRQSLRGYTLSAGVYRKEGEVWGSVGSRDPCGHGFPT